MEIQTQNTSLAIPPQETRLLEWIRTNKTPLEAVETREGRSGMTFYYLRHQYVTEKLNELTGFDWDFEVVRERLEEDEITVLGRLTIRVNGHTITKSQYGSCGVKRVHGGKALSIGDDFKAAASDALKKCASLIGMGLDLTVPIRPETMRALHAAGVKAWKDNWDAKRPWLVKMITGDSKKTSAHDLLDVEARLAVAMMNGDKDAEAVQKLSAKFGSR